MKRTSISFVSMTAMVAAAFASPAAAQSIGYGDFVGSDAPDAGPAGDAGSSAKRSRGSPKQGSMRGRNVEIVPYIEVAQVVTAELSPGDEVFTYTQVAAGVDAAAIGKNNGVSLSLRYERRIAWDDDTSDGDTISGVAQGYTTLAPGVQIHAGGLAARTRVEDGGAAILGPLGDDDAVTQVYSVYAGPSIATMAGDVAISANYRAGYTKVEEPDVVRGVPGSPMVDVFDESVVHVASVTAGLAPDRGLPVGIGAGANYYREDISNLDQRVEDFRASGTVTVPVQQDLALTGSIGYEHVEVSSRDALRDANGNPVVGSNGRYVTNKSSPRILAYDIDGLIWDAGVMWRPSSRTALEAHVGRRYGATSVWGTFTYAPNARSSFAVAVYDNVAGFGGQVNRFLAELPTDFEAVRNPITGDLSGCVSSLEDGNCLAGALGSVRSATFRARGVAANYSRRFGEMSAGIGAGYDRRKFIAAPGTVLASANGVVDENYWLAGYFSARIDRSSSFSTNVYAYWLDAGDRLTGDVSALGATAAYYRNITNNLTATAALGLDGLDRDDRLEDLWTASALLGVRYNF